MAAVNPGPEIPKLGDGAPHLPGFGRCGLGTIPHMRKASRCGAPQLLRAAVVLMLVLLATALGACVATPLTLPQAVEMALQQNPLRKAAAAEERAAAADIRIAHSAVLPRINFSEAATRGNDPVYVFGTRLRQGRFTAADFALNRLNTPTPVGNFATRFGGNWKLFDSFASFLDIRRAQQMRDAASHQLDRADQETIFRVVSAYYELLLAAKQQQLAEQTAHTGDAILEEAKNRYETGLVVQSDYLAAQVNSATRQQELIAAQNAVQLAQAELANAIGTNATTMYEPAEALAEVSFTRDALSELEAVALEKRPDLRRAGDEVEAQKSGVRLAKAAFGPRLNGFANWELDNPTFLAGNGGNNWTAGLELSVDLFSGGEKAARMAQQKEILERATEMREAARDAVRLEVRRAYYQTDAARRMLDVSRASIQQAEEGLRIVQDRYNSGLTTITDLLRSEDASRRARTDYWQAVYRYRISYANLELASGRLNAGSPGVTQ